MIENLIILFVFIIFLLEFYKDLIIYQQNQYIVKRYLKTIKRKHMIVSIIGVLLTVILVLVKQEAVQLVLVFILTVIGIVVEYNKHYKVNFKFTSRMKRISFLILIVTAISCAFINLNYLGILVVLNSFYFLIFHYIMQPIEQSFKKSFINKAKKKLNSYNVSVVGITGSYGKTSTKNILNDLIKNSKYTLPTPASFNTPLGISTTINKELLPLHEVFIAEMGAYKIGEIKENCSVAKPNIAIITSIGKAHLESFGSEDNILEGKFEIVESLPSDGIAILNADDDKMMSYQIKNDCKVLTYSIEKESDLKAYNIQTTIKGISFNYMLDGIEYTAKTKLLGKHNVYNILSCILVARSLGVAAEEIERNIPTINQISHRLELRTSYDSVIIDDAFNSNPVGAREAALTLGLMEGYRVTMTPGMVELGEKEYELNKEFAITLASNSDYVYVVGKDRSKPFVDAFEECNFTNYEVVNTTNEGFKKFFSLKNQNKILLIENDLSDIY